MELILNVPPLETKTIIISIVCSISLIYFFFQEIKVFFIRFQNEDGEKNVIYYLLYKEFQKTNYTPNYIFKSFFQGDTKLPKNVKFENNSGIKFWKEIYERHPKNLISCLNRNKIRFNDFYYFDRLIKDRFENNLEYKYSEEIFAEYIVNAKQLAYNGNKNQSLRLGAIAFEIELTSCENNKSPESKLNHWNKVLGLYGEDTLTEKSFFSNPFYFKGSQKNPRKIFKQAIELIQFLNKMELEEAIAFVKNKIEEETKDDKELNQLRHIYKL